MGPEGGKKGGEVVCVGTPEKIGQCERSYTGKFLRGKIGNSLLNHIMKN